MDTVRTVAAYARYSSDKQRDASIDDQLRNVRAYCARMGWPEPVIYQDAAISGARNDRPGYLRLLADAHLFDVILVDDLPRLSRDSVEAQRQVRNLRFSGVRVVSVSDGIDTAEKGHKVGVGLRGLMGEIYLDDLRDKTHRGLTGRALAGASAGGLPYGYRVTGTGERTIDPDQAAIIRRIYDAYIAGDSPRQIAIDLNRDGVPSPRGSTWAGTAIRPDVKRGIGILANPIYIGRQVWNRSHWVKHPETGRRIRRERPPEEWITTEHPELAIVSPEQWQAAQARHSRRTKGAGRPGRPPRHLLSGILRCGGCGGPLVVVDRYNYACGRSKDRGTCPAPIRVSIKDAERELLAGVRAQLLSEDAYRRYLRAVSERLRAHAPDLTALQRRLQTATRERDNIMLAIRAGVITPTTKSELEAAERDVEQAEAELAQAKAYQPSTLLPRARERWQNAVEAMSDRARGNTKAREALQKILGTVTVRNENGDIVADIADSTTAPEHAQINVVAGAGFANYLTEPFRVVLTPARPAS